MLDQQLRVNCSTHPCAGASVLRAKRPNRMISRTDTRKRSIQLGLLGDFDSGAGLARSKEPGKSCRIAGNCQTTRPREALRRILNIHEILDHQRSASRLRRAGRSPSYFDQRKGDCGDCFSVKRRMRIRRVEHEASTIYVKEHFGLQGGPSSALRAASIPSASFSNLEGKMKVRLSTVGTS